MNNLQLRSRLKMPCVVKDDVGRIIYERNADGYWCERKYADDKLVYFADSNGATMENNNMSKKLCKVVSCQF